MEPNEVLRNGEVKHSNLTAPQMIKKPPSLTPSVEEGDDVSEEEGQVTPLPGSTVELDIDNWPTDDEYQVRMTVIPSVQDEERRKSRYSAYHERRPYIPQPDNHLCLAIIAMICCCFPLGIVGFICALQVDKVYDDGNREGAVWRSKHAKYWSLTAVVFGMLGIIGVSFYLIFFHLVPAVS